MRALAEVVMRGRAQAAVVAAFSSLLLPLISGAAIALVSLRRGAFEGTQTLFCAILPVVVFGLLAQRSEAVVLFLLYCVVGLLIVVYGSALVLRSTSSWRLTLTGIMGMSFIAGAGLPLTAPDLSNTLLDELNRATEAIAEAASGAAENNGAGAKSQPAPTPITIGAGALSGLVAFAVGYAVVLCLALGRWWQAILYNPGGFQAEFHQLRLGQVQALLSFGLMAVVIPQAAYQVWAYLFALPLVVVATAVVHNLVKQRGLGSPWLVFYYLVLVLFSPYSGLLVALFGFADTWFDFRRRIGSRGGPSPT